LKGASVEEYRLSRFWRDDDLFKRTFAANFADVQYLLNISGMMHIVPKVSSKNRVIVQTFGTFPRFTEMIRCSRINKEKFVRICEIRGYGFVFPVKNSRTGISKGIGWKKMVIAVQKSFFQRPDRFPQGSG
jgi:hypothetical protein